MSDESIRSEIECSDDSLETVYYRGALIVGDLINPGHKSNFGSRRQANHGYLTATVDAATWGAELAAGEEPGPEMLNSMKEQIEHLRELGVEAIDE